MKFINKFNLGKPVNFPDFSETVTCSCWLICNHMTLFYLISCDRSWRVMFCTKLKLNSGIKGAIWERSWGPGLLCGDLTIWHCPKNIFVDLFTFFILFTWQVINFVIVLILSQLSILQEFYIQIHLFTK